MQTQYQRNHKLIRNGWVILLFLVLAIPLGSWIANAPFKDAYGSSFLTFKLLGQCTGIIGAQLFAFSLILSGRISFLEKLFGGLDRMYRIHHRTGVIAFTFLAVHPLLLACQFAFDSVKDAAEFLSPIGNTPAITLGIFSMLLMVVLLFVTFYGSYFKYPALKAAHKFLGLAFFLGFLHVVLIPSSLSTDAVLKWSLLITSFTGIALFVYRTILGRFLVPRFTYTVDSVVSVVGGITELTLIPSTKPLYHLPGQFGILSFPRLSALPPEEHPFTISSAGIDGRVRFSIKGLGDYTKEVIHVKPGDVALVEGPFGEFSYVYGGQRQVWVAGGVGVTPFVSMAEHIMMLDELPYTIDFYYSVRTEADASYKEVFENLSKKHPSFSFHLVPSDTKGYVTGELLSQENKDLADADIFICGPPPMMDGLIAQLLPCGVSRKQIHTEKFSLLK